MWNILPTQWKKTNKFHNTWKSWNVCVCICLRRVFSRQMPRRQCCWKKSWKSPGSNHEAPIRLANRKHCTLLTQSNPHPRVFVCVFKAKRRREIRRFCMHGAFVIWKREKFDWQLDWYLRSKLRIVPMHNSWASITYQVQKTVTHNQSKWPSNCTCFHSHYR